MQINEESCRGKIGQEGTAGVKSNQRYSEKRDWGNRTEVLQDRAE